MAAPKGNRNAAKGKICTDALRKALIQGKALAPIAKKLIEKAKNGDLEAIKQIYNRMDGMPVQGLANADGQPFVVNITR
jgi:ribosomal protein L17